MLDATLKFYELNKLYEHDDTTLSPSETPLAWRIPFHKCYPRFPKVMLPQNVQPEGLKELWDLRRSIRTFSSKPISLMTLAAVLRSCSILEQNAMFERRTYPSPGARFPIELYLVIYAVEDVEPGIYHYNIVDSSLELVLPRNQEDDHSIFNSVYLERPACSIIFCAELSRLEVKYGHKAYQYALLEAGHISQNIHLASTSLGLGCCSIGGFLNDKIASLLDLTSDEIPVYVNALGYEREEIKDI